MQKFKKLKTVLFHMATLSATTLSHFHNCTYSAGTRTVYHVDSQVSEMKGSI